MARQLIKLRLVPDDELKEIKALLDEHDIAHYETSAGNWGISMPALWLVNDDEYESARNILDEYAEQRLQNARQEYDESIKAGNKRTFLDMARENPYRYVLFILCIAGLIYISLVPFLAMMS